jgi:hypothetical protein
MMSGANNQHILAGVAKQLSTMLRQQIGVEFGIAAPAGNIHQFTIIQAANAVACRRATLQAKTRGRPHLDVGAIPLVWMSEKGSRIDFLQFSFTNRMVQSHILTLSPCA